MESREHANRSVQTSFAVPTLLHETLRVPRRLAVAFALLRFLGTRVALMSANWPCWSAPASWL
eukprot:12905166-Prorocentrum_lima.AAC.1